jgi:hypothetical protein
MAAVSIRLRPGTNRLWVARYKHVLAPRLVLLGRRRLGGRRADELVHRPHRRGALDHLLHLLIGDVDGSHPLPPLLRPKELSTKLVIDQDSTRTLAFGWYPAVLVSARLKPMETLPSGWYLAGASPTGLS